jgi:hypothetical protein
MSIDEVILDAAYEIYEEFGPARRVPQRDRLHQKYPHLTEGEMDTLVNEMMEISRTVWSIAELGGEAKIGKDKIIALLQARHPYLKAGGLTRATFMVNYLAMHEGYDR